MQIEVTPQQMKAEAEALKFEALSLSCRLLAYLAKMESANESKALELALAQAANGISLAAIRINEVVEYW